MARRRKKKLKIKKLTKGLKRYGKSTVKYNNDAHNNAPYYLYDNTLSKNYRTIIHSEHNRVYIVDQQVVVINSTEMFLEEKASKN